jgi:hypothetical protein
MKRRYLIPLILAVALPALARDVNSTCSSAPGISGEACCIDRGGVCGCTGPNVTICCNGTAVNCECPGRQ